MSLVEKWPFFGGSVGENLKVAKVLLFDKVVHAQIVTITLPPAAEVHSDGEGRLAVGWFEGCLQLVCDRFMLVSQGEVAEAATTVDTSFPDVTRPVVVWFVWDGVDGLVVMTQQLGFRA